jgi:hypothetical protein
MTLDQILQQETKDSELWLSREKEESVYKRDLKKRIELINWVLQIMKNPVDNGLKTVIRNICIYASFVLS